MTNQIDDAPAKPTGCPLSWPEQRRNLIIFACCTGMQYLAAPVLYVGITQASLCKLLGGDTRTSNLPATFVPRNGVMLGDLTKEQRDKAMSVVAAVLSKDGYQKVIDAICQRIIGSQAISVNQYVSYCTLVFGTEKSFGIC